LEKGHSSRKKQKKNEVSCKTNFTAASARKTAGGEVKGIGCSCYVMEI